MNVNSLASTSADREPFICPSLAKNLDCNNPGSLLRRSGNRCSLVYIRHQSNLEFSIVAPNAPSKLPLSEYNQ